MLSEEPPKWYALYGMYDEHAPVGMGNTRGEAWRELCDGDKGRIWEDDGPGVVGDPGDDERVLKMMGDGDDE